MTTTPEDIAELLKDKDTWRRTLSRSDTWLVIAGNCLPLIGIFFLGWDASTLLVLYWLETAIVGLWLFVRLCFAGDSGGTDRAGRPSPGGIVLAVFLLFHGGLFMGGHLFFLTDLAPGEWRQHLGSPVDFVVNFIIPSGVWLPLAGLFVVRAVVTFHEIRGGNPAAHLIAGFYARIILMQFVIIFGGMLAMMFGSPMPLLVLMVLLKIAIELLWDILGGPFIAAFEQPKPKQGS